MLRFLCTHKQALFPSLIRVYFTLQMKQKKKKTSCFFFFFLLRRLSSDYGYSDTLHNPQLTNHSCKVGCTIQYNQCNKHFFLPISNKRRSKDGMQRYVLFTRLQSSAFPPWWQSLTEAEEATAQQRTAEYKGSNPLSAQHFWSIYGSFFFNLQFPQINLNPFTTLFIFWPFTLFPHN